MNNDYRDVIQIREVYTPSEANQAIREGWELLAIEPVDVPIDEGVLIRDRGVNLRRLIYVLGRRARLRTQSEAEMTI